MQHMLALEIINTHIMYFNMVAIIVMNEEFLEVNLKGSRATITVTEPQCGPNTKLVWYSCLNLYTRIKRIIVSSTVGISTGKEARPPANSRMYVPWRERFTFHHGIIFIHIRVLWFVNTR